MKFEMADNSIIELASLSHQGMVRKANEDYFGFYVPRSQEQRQGMGSIFIVADGIGGYSKGEVASRMAVQEMTGYFSTHPGKYDMESIEKMVDHVNRKIIDFGMGVEGGRAGTTFCALVVVGDRTLVVNSGDSRVYRVRTGEIELLSKDHSVVQEMIDRGAIKPEEAGQQTYKNLVTSALGVEEKAAFEYNRYILKDRDLYILCTDGLYNMVNDREILEIVQGNDPEKASTLLVELANQRGGSDNITLQIVSYSRPQKSGTLGPVIIALITAFILALFWIPSKTYDRLFSRFYGTRTPSVDSTVQPVPDKTPGETVRIMAGYGHEADRINVYFNASPGADAKEKKWVHLATLMPRENLALELSKEGEYKFRLERNGYVPMEMIQLLRKGSRFNLDEREPWQKRVLEINLSREMDLRLRRVTPLPGEEWKKLGRKKRFRLEEVELGFYIAEISDKDRIEMIKRFTVEEDSPLTKVDVKLNNKPTGESRPR